MSLKKKKKRKVNTPAPDIYIRNGSRKSHTSLLGFLTLLDKKLSVDFILKDLKSDSVFHVWKHSMSWKHLTVWIWHSLLQ